MKNLIMICALVLGSQVAKAGGFIEPYLGYQTGKVEISGGSTLKDKGTALGLRAGYQMVIPWFALDAKMYKGKDDASPQDDVSFTDVGVTVGASVPFLRPFIGYIPSAKIKSEGTGFDMTIKGTGLKLGLGIKILPLIDINIEHTTYSLKDPEVNGVTFTGTKADYTTTMIGLGMTF
ncbi:hypothetical protein CIK05_03270 [Bdellovibrio sp. qaytius]|nr:hypothetical protein CIK05_03270 [Bdellovibrio sp. qaytius]